MTRISHGNPSRYFWSETNMNDTQMGRYLTEREWGLIAGALGRHDFPELVLDVGGGDGRFAVRLSSGGVRAIILELDPVPIRELMCRGWDELVVVGDGRRLPFRDACFDAAMVVEVPFREPIAHLLAEWREVLKTGGILMLTTHNAVSMIGLERLARPSKYRLTSGEYADTYWSVKDAILGTGFEVLEVHGFRWVFASRKSRSRFVPLWAYLERLLRLDRLPWIAPWIFWVARKS